ncbi:MAG: HEAT repeat domain-containing protein [Planctomycetes bacterium]|nr:HEAT repeat domain-containing protein [Planctomycetota bacterium]
MKSLLALLLLLALAAFGLQSAASAHGGAYRGPGGTTAGGGDTAPSSGSGGGTSSGASGGTTSGGTRGPASPGASSGSGGGGTNSSRPNLPGTSMPTGPLQAEWEPWWAFNRDPFLNLKAILHHGDLVLGSDNYFLGHVPVDLARDRLAPDEEEVRTRIAPALLRVLVGETDNDLVSGAQVALAKIGERAGPAGVQETTARLRDLLASPNQELAETAAVSLGILADARNLELLRELLFDTERGRVFVAGHEVNWRTRAFAAYGLGLIGFRSKDPVVRRQVVRDLTEALDGDVTHMALPDVAVACLTALGLVPLSEDPNCLLRPEDELVPTHCRRGQLRWLLDFAEREHLHYMIAAHVPTTIVRLLAGASTDLDLRHEVLARFMAQAESRTLQRELRASAILALGALGDAGDDGDDTHVRALLLRMARESREPQTRTLALIAAGQVGGRRSGDVSADEEGAGEVRRALMTALAKGRSSDRAWAALSLALLERSRLDAGLVVDQSVAAALRQAFLETRAPAEIGAFAIGLGIMREAGAAGLLLTRLREISDDRARGYLCLALGLMNAREAVPDLRELLANSRYRPLLLREVAISLGLLGDKLVVDDLVAQLQTATSLTAQSTIASALGSIGDARSVGPLLEMLSDPELNVRARAFAAVALGIVADKEPLPWNSKIAVGVNYLANPPTLTDGQGRGILDIL